MNLRRDDRAAMQRAFAPGLNGHTRDTAKLMGLAPSSLLNGLNPNCDTHDVGWTKMVKYMLATGEREPIRLMARILGGVFVDLRRRPTDGIKDAILKDTIRLYDHAASVGDAILRVTADESDGGAEITANEWPEVEMPTMALVEGSYHFLLNTRQRVVWPAGERRRT